MKKYFIFLLFFSGLCAAEWSTHHDKDMQLNMEKWGIKDVEGAEIYESMNLYLGCNDGQSDIIMISVSPTENLPAEQLVQVAYDIDGEKGSYKGVQFYGDLGTTPIPQELIEKMMKGQTMTLSFPSLDGNYVQSVVSLKGFKVAYKWLQTRCEK